MDNHFLAEVLAITKKRGSGKAPVISELSVIENGTYEAPSGVDGYSPVIVNVPTGGGGGAAVLQSGVNLIDYDGSLVQHYTKEEFLALSAMPSNPSHDGLVAQGWNWSLADAKTYVEKYGSLIIGQMYTTDTGDTRIYIHIDKNTPQNRLTFYVRFTSSVADNVDIDWGDGTVETKGSTTATTYPHTYATGGDYVIKLKVNTGTISFVGNGTSSTSTSGQSIYGSRANNYSYNRARIRRIEVGNDVVRIGNSALHSCYSITSITIPNSVTSIGTYVFNNCYSLTSITIPYGVISILADSFANCYSLISITIPNSVTSIAGNTFISCYSLTSIIIPEGVTSIASTAFSGCYSLTSITIPNGVTSITTSMFGNCYSLTSITIPLSVTSIGDTAFSNCYGISEYHLLSITPPELTNVNAFASLASDCKFYVPYSEDHSILAAYQTATNWSTYASRMVEEPQAA